MSELILKVCNDCGKVPEVTEDPLANIWNRWRLLHLCAKAGHGPGLWVELQGAKREYVVRRWNAMNSKDETNPEEFERILKSHRAHPIP